MSYPSSALLVGVDDSVTEVLLSRWPDYRNHLDGEEFFINVSPSVTLWVNEAAWWSRRPMPINNIGCVLNPYPKYIRGPMLVTGPNRSGVTPVGRKAVELAAQVAAVLVEDNKHKEDQP